MIPVTAPLRPFFRISSVSEYSGRPSPEVAAGRRLAVDEPEQIQHLDDAVGTQVEVLADERFDPRFIDFGG
jgi:hypothetical protein